MIISLLFLRLRVDGQKISVARRRLLVLAYTTSIYCMFIYTSQYIYICYDRLMSTTTTIHDDDDDDESLANTISIDVTTI